MNLKDIKFRGKKSFGDREFVYGNYAFVDGVHWILPFSGGESEYMDDWISVTPKSIGQYTGFKDQKGKEIYSGEKLIGKSTIVKDCQAKNPKWVEVEFECEVVFEDGAFKLYRKDEDHHFGIEHSKRYLIKKTTKP